MRLNVLYRLNIDLFIILFGNIISSVMLFYLITVDKFFVLLISSVMLFYLITVDN